jgi:hypothetical protein
MTYQIGEYRAQYGTPFLYHGINPRIPNDWVRLPGVAVPNSFTGSTSFAFNGPQGFIMAIRNANVLGAPVTVEHRQDRTSYGQIILPMHTLLLYWSFFAPEPFRWSFSIRAQGAIVCTLAVHVRRDYLARVGQP